MKSLKFGLMVLMLFSSVSYALNPIPGWYAGLIVGGSKAPDIRFNVKDPIGILSRNPVDMISGQGVITSSVLGNVGGQVGYRMNHLRVEGEFFYNNNPYSHLTDHGTSVPNSGSSTSSANFFSRPKPLTFDGYTNTYALMFNGFYDIYISNYTENWVPYVGLGAGFEQVENNIDFLINGSSAANSTFSQQNNHLAGQAIAGVSYFITDYVSFNADFRYLSAFRSSTVNTRVTSFQSRPQIYSINLIVNSAFNLA